jgi:hypothetical protein
MHTIQSGNDGIIKFLNGTILDLKEVLNKSEEILDSESVTLLQGRIDEAHYLVSRLTGEGFTANDRIETVLEEYSMANMTLDDVKSMAARYSYSYPDCQIRAILHIIGHSNTIVTVPQGWKVVPVRLNHKMRLAAVEASDADDGMGDFFDSVYEAMLESSPNLGGLVDTRSALKMAIRVGGEASYKPDPSLNWRDQPISSIKFTTEQLNFFVNAIMGMDRVT